MTKRDVQIKGLIFNVQRCSVHDGPGIRTTVFFKGCPLRCLWCDNPESINPVPEIMFDNSKCTSCYKCLSACPQNAITASSDGIKIDREACDNCGECTKVCNSKALDICGSYSKLDDLLYEIKRDIPFFGTSGGGITATGGEPVLQHEFLKELFKSAHGSAIHTALETSGYAPWKALKNTLRETDLVLYDIKTIDPELHREMTGVSNELILQNLERMTLSDINLIVRVPVIPGHNIVSERDIHKIGVFLAELGGIDRIDLMPYHKFGISKYKMLDRQYSFEANPP
ncbi:MAG: glycyl-radical enzyme activating protein, partial [Promethearchaeota archaeon]